MGPKNDVRAFAALCGRLEFVSQPFRCFDFNRDAEILLKFFAYFGQAAIALIAIDPNKEFAVCPGKCLARRKEYKESRKEFCEHTNRLNAGGLAKSPLAGNGKEKIL
jgi:hypothetical protein